MAAEADRESTGEAGRKGEDKPTLLQVISGLLKWPALVWAAIGALNALRDLLPALKRFSLIVQGLMGAYRISREWLYDQVQWLFAWVHIDIPEIPEVWKDGLVISGLVLVALNFESLRRDGSSLIWAIVRHVASIAVSVVRGGDSRTSSLLSNNLSPTLQFALVVLVYWLWGLALDLGLRAFGLDIALPWLVNHGGLETAIQASAFALGLLGVILIAVRLAGSGDRPARNPVEAVARIFVFVVHFPAAMLGLVVNALLNGWRSVLIAATLVVALVALNWLCLAYIDPTVEDPPPWLVQLVNAGGPEIVPAH